MSLREQLRSRYADLVLRERLTLPEAGVEIQVRSLMLGEINRINDAKRPKEVQIALSAEDPATGKLIWNPNSFEDLEEIAAMALVDSALVLQTSDRLSGYDRLGKLLSPPSENGSSSSLSSSGAPSTS